MTELILLLDAGNVRRRKRATFSDSPPPSSIMKNVSFPTLDLALKFLSVFLMKNFGHALSSQHLHSSYVEWSGPIVCSSSSSRNLLESNVGDQDQLEFNGNNLWIDLFSYTRMDNLRWWHQCTDDFEYYMKEILKNTVYGLNFTQRWGHSLWYVLRSIV